MNWMIDGVDFYHIEAEKYWSFGKTYKGDIKTEINNMIYSGDYLGSEKVDGCYYRFLKDEDGKCYLIARSENVKGDMTDKYEWVPQFHEFFNSLPNGTCFLGEVHLEKDSASRKVTTIMGCLKDKAIARQEKEKLWYYIFDVWAYNDESYMNKTAAERFQLLREISICHQAKYIHFANYYSGKELWDELIRVRAANGEGLVITRATAKPEPGKRTARKTLKIKKELDNYIDCFLTGNYKPSTMDYKGDHIEDWQYWYNEHTDEKLLGSHYKEYSLGEPIRPVSKGFFNDWASAVEIGVYNGNTVYPVGWISGITEEVKNGIVHDPDKWTGRVVSINAMEIEEVEPGKPKFRHGKIMEWRTDKIPKDCEFSQLV